MAQVPRFAPGTQVPPVTFPPNTDTWVNPYEARLNELREQARRANEAEPKTEMYSPEEQAQRRAQNLYQQRLGMVGGIANDPGISNVSEPLLKRALEAQKPRYSDHGQFDEVSGSFKFFPGVMEQRRQEAINRQLQSTETASAGAEARRDEGIRRSRDQSNLQLTLAAIGAAGRGGSGNTGTWTYMSSHPETGQPIFYNGKLNQMMSGGKILDPASTIVAPKLNNMPAVAKKAMSENNISLAHADQALEHMKTPEGRDAFGPVTYLPNVARQYVEQKPWLGGGDTSLIGGGKQGTTVRAIVAALASVRIHDLSGAAVAAAEWPRLKPHVPNVDTDTPESIEQKVKLFRDEFAMMKAEIEAGYPMENVLRGRPQQGGAGASWGQPHGTGASWGGAPAGPAAAPSPAAPAAAPAPTQDLRKKYGL